MLHMIAEIYLFVLKKGESTRKLPLPLAIICSNRPGEKLPGDFIDYLQIMAAKR